LLLPLVLHTLGPGRLLCGRSYNNVARDKTSLLITVSPCNAATSQHSAHKSSPSERLSVVTEHHSESPSLLCSSYQVPDTTTLKNSALITVAVSQVLGCYSSLAFLPQVFRRTSLDCRPPNQHQSEVTCACGMWH